MQKGHSRYLFLYQKCPFVVYADLFISNCFLLTHRLFLLFDHLTNHLATDASSLSGCEVTVVTVFQVYSKLGCNLHFESVHSVFSLWYFHSVARFTHDHSPPYILVFILRDNGMSFLMKHSVTETFHV